ncbi:CHC2 zinc finger domain-containing protein [Streptomyces sp. NPDC057363]|uniref:CHC2 zinc finger domain-containing protein n=1 Tax=Streptomyces sp. NPDC057363 TaxID=3346107 RepID=UPI00363EFF07
MANEPRLKPPIARVLNHFYGFETTRERGRVKIPCPLPDHPDSNPSASVDLDKDRWNCFACNLSEDSYAVIMRENGFGFTQAKEFAHTKFGRNSQDVPRTVRGESGSGVRQSSGSGRRSSSVRSGVRRFGDTWS